MKQHLGSLLEEIQELEKRVLEKIQHTTEELSYEIKDGKAVFALEVRRRHKALVTRIWRYLGESSFLTVVTAPVIYSILIPNVAFGSARQSVPVDLFSDLSNPTCSTPRIRGDGQASARLPELHREDQLRLLWLRQWCIRVRSRGRLTHRAVLVSNQTCSSRERLSRAAVPVLRVRRRRGFSTRL